MENDAIDIVERLRASALQARALDRSVLLTQAATEIILLRKANSVLSALLSAKERACQPDSEVSVDG